MSAARSEEWSGCWQHRSQLWALADQELQPAEPVRRYQWARPGDMFHVDTKYLARFERVGYRITRDRRLGFSRGAVYEKANVTIDGASRLAYFEVLPDEKQSPTAGFFVAGRDLVRWSRDQL